MQNKISNFKFINNIIEKNEFHIKKKYGQNFLIDTNVLSSIVNSVNISKDDMIIEIGPGFGSLTELLCERAGFVLAYEIDSDLIDTLKENLSKFNNFEIINEDILKVDINNDIEKYNKGYKNIYVVANLPYYITTPIITSLLTKTDKIKKYVMMMQDEVADRICGVPKTKDYNALSIFIKYKATAKKIIKVNRNSFYPAPNVDSAVILLDVYDEKKYFVDDEELFYHFIRIAFNQRRKTLVNNLLAEYNKNYISVLLKQHNIKLNARSEELDIDTFISLCNFISNKKLTLKANAKINLALEVMNEIDGYHMVNNLMVPIDLYDILEFEKNDDIILVDNNIDDNIIIKAANLILKGENVNGGVKIKLNKNIPVGAGLAGGSTDAAYTLIGIDLLYNLNISQSKLKEYASKLGSDVPFFIDNVLSLCTNRGEIINPIDINYKKIPLLLINPGFPILTKDVYKNYIYDGISKMDKIDNIVEALKKGNYKKLENNIFNDLEAVALKLSKELLNLYNELKKKYNVHISGSGPTMYILNLEENEIKKIKEKYNNLFIFSGYIMN